ncbi:RNA-directed DNA polymerase [Polycladomyces sp. WAk]|uniref:RNA-directed DNA polymerase n=1 Tax=Polycladomyces zharkentensis TaxID=2807616 RepID=A0ABS2WJ20_9BACL|nr:reverse transcriptase family protein [Polycladomyces sp. WAk]MBN2909557.1 RNA-directed DNA polymerase [Polycladomyces sp. WAk]
MAEGENRPLTREEWIARVREEGREETIRSEMIRLGFWSNDSLPEEERRQQALEDEEYRRLRQKLAELQRESAKLENIDQLLKEARRKRIEESKKKRAERKERRERERAEAKKRWESYRQHHIVHAGVGVSGGLQETEWDEEKLRQHQLPLIRTAEELAEAMGITLSRLKWLTYHRQTATVCHYYRFTIPKKSGGRREISSPKKALREAQSWIKEQILDRIPPHPAACGFVPGKSTLDHARQHLRQHVVVKMDLKDFFPSITFYRVKGLFQSFGYSELISTLLALLCTEPPRKEVTFDGKVYHVAIGERQLPQGACTSPAITNLICRSLDRRLEGLAKAKGFRYSRYADDLAFSGGIDGEQQIGSLLNMARRIIRDERFEVQEEKTRVMRSSNRQKITGIVVNEKLNLRRRELRAFRALLHSVEKNGLAQENRHHHPDFWGYIKGMANYIRMVRPDWEARLAKQLVRIGKKHELPVPKWCQQAVVKG